MTTKCSVRVYHTVMDQVSLLSVVEKLNLLYWSAIEDDGRSARRGLTVVTENLVFNCLFLIDLYLIDIAPVV